MKKIIFSALIAFAVNTVLAQNNESISIGSSLPMMDVKMKDISGKDITIKDAMSKNGVLVMFSCNTCPYVIKNQERTKQIGKYALQNNIGVIIINSNEAQRNDVDSYTAMQAYAKAQNYTWYYTVDNNSKIADAFGASRTPEVFLFNVSSKLVYKGAIDDNPTDAASVKQHYLKEAIDAMVTNKEISVKESRSIGCGIKRLS